MKTPNNKRKIAETVMGAAVGAAIAGPAGAVAGGIVGSQAAAHSPHFDEKKRAPKKRSREADDPLIHVQLKRILVPVDFSEPSRGAVRFAREWAARFGSEVCLLHVIEPASTYGVVGIEPVLVPLPPPDFHAETRTELEKIVKQEFPESSSVSVHLRDGVPFDQIASAARDLAADIIIIATHGRTGLSHALLGSTAERVVRHAPCPVLTLRSAR
jgi:nucleotide-binding universal stress UspA family protein